MTIPETAAPADGGKIRIRIRRVQCCRSDCTKCPHGPYYWAIWRDKIGKKQERYLGKMMPHAVLLTTPIMITNPPQIGSAVILFDSPWATLGPGMRGIWHSVVSTFRVDGYGVSYFGRRRSMSEWVSLRTQNGDRIYRRSEHRVPTDEGLDQEWKPPGDVRWPLSILTAASPPDG